MNVNKNRAVATAVFIAALSLLFDAGLAEAAGWNATGPMATARSKHSATLLANGKVLVAGGSNSGGLLSSAELYTPGTGISTGTWSATGPMTDARELHTATLLTNGKVLVTGGTNAAGTALSSAQLYDPVAGSWSATGAMTNARHSHTATFLNGPACRGAAPPAYCGKVMVVGGINATFPAVSLPSAELYDPTAGTWSSAGNLAFSRYSHTATLLDGLACQSTTPPVYCGKVVVAGGGGGVDDSQALNTAELFDPAALATNVTWVPTGPLNVARFSHAAEVVDGAATVCGASCGNVLISGGTGADSATDVVTGRTSELYDPLAGTWRLTGRLVFSRLNHTATRLGGGRILAAGGIGGSSSAELFDPLSASWVTTASLVTGRDSHTATLLPSSGKVLAAGGHDTLLAAELYTP